MIPRYSRPEMVAIWEPDTRFRIWFEIEAHAATAMAEIGIIPKSAAETIWAKGTAAKFDAARIDAIERVTKHDVIAFLTHLAEFVGEDARFVHQGMTSSDVLDTCLSVQLVRASDLLLADLDRLLAALKARALEHKMTPTIGRSHGIHAEPVTFGLKLAQAYAEFARARKRMEHARAEIATCAISGAVGTFANIDPRVEAHVAQALGLTPEPVSTQVIPRDRHAMFFATLAVIASSIERLAIEIRHLQRSEVYEAEEFFSEGQKGSSAMPHKRNPVLSENLTGLARMVRSYAMPAMENVALWHERDISHSSVERMIGPDATITLDFALSRLAGVIEKLVVYPQNMKKNLDRLGGLIHSQRVMLALTQKGVSREDAYACVQRNAMPVWRGEGDFLTLLKADKDVMAKLSAKELEVAASTSATTPSTSMRSSPACSGSWPLALVILLRNERTARALSRCQVVPAVGAGARRALRTRTGPRRATDDGRVEAPREAGQQFYRRDPGSARPRNMVRHGVGSGGQDRRQHALSGRGCRPARPAGRSAAGRATCAACRGVVAEFRSDRSQGKGRRVYKPRLARGVRRRQPGCADRLDLAAPAGSRSSIPAGTRRDQRTQRCRDGRPPRLDAAPRRALSRHRTPVGGP